MYAVKVSPYSSDILLAGVCLRYHTQANCNRLLDVARETYKENIGDIYHLSRELSETHDLPLTLLYQDTGFVFSLKKKDLYGRELPPGFVNVVMRKGKWVFSSMMLVSRSSLFSG